MNINIKTTNIELTPAIRSHVDKCLEKITKMLGNDPAFICDIELANTSGHHNKGDIFKTEIHIVGKNKNLYASAESSALFSSIEDVRDEILSELKASKKKNIAFVRRGGARMKAMMRGMWPWGKDEGTLDA